jgi:Fic family protein
LNKGELTHFCQAFFQILLFAQEHIIDELQTKTTQLHSLFETVEDSLCDFTEDERQVILRLGEQHLFGFAGDGLSKKEIEAALEISGYKVNKAFDVLIERGIIEIIKKKPLVVMLAGEFTRALGWE